MKKNKRYKPKLKKPKLRVPVAPPGSRHKSEKDYDRKKEKEAIKDDVEKEYGYYDRDENGWGF